MEINSFVIGYKKGKAAGGAATHPIHTVTFMSEDGAEVLYKRSVVDGDNCADVVARGLLATPTKESTAQYNYTHSGWSRTGGAAASSSALSAVTEDRTVYAAYTSAVRYYTVTYLDEDGAVLKTESLAYGSMPSYEPTKDGYVLNGWTPEVTAVTGDASYTAAWAKQITLDDYTWAQLDAMTLEEAQQKFKLGDKKTFEMKYSATGSVNMTAVLVGFNVDDLESGGKAKMTFVGRVGTGKQLWGAVSGTGATYPTSRFVTYNLVNYDTWQDADFANAVKAVKKSYLNSATDTTLATINAKWWLPSVVELGYTHASAAPEGNIYPLFAENSNNYFAYDIFVEYIAFATRSRMVGDQYKYLTIKANNVTPVAANKDNYFMLGFCI